MEHIYREIRSHVEKRLFKGKAIIVYGPRQSGKTTMIKDLIKEHRDDTLWLNGDSPDIRELLEYVTVAKWKSIIGSKKIVVIDEAQRITNIGLSMKLITDELPDIQLIATGSSAFELANRMNEPLTGRKFEFTLLPFSFSELCAHSGLIEEKQSLHRRLLYGSYPEIVNSIGDEVPLLSMLANSYLYKDILMLDGIKRPQILDKLIRALALQIGSEVSINELSRLIGADNKTISKYIDLLEKSFVIFTLPAYSSNARVEIRRGRKIYFYDLGVRNAMIGNFLPLEARTDAGALWENYLIVERMKKQVNKPFPPKSYFWRNVEQREVDYLEDSPDSLDAWEFKWNPKAKGKIPKAFTKAYPHAETAIVGPKNYDDFLL